MSNSEVLRRALKQGSVAALLKEHGFRSSGLSWIRRFPGGAHLLQFQVSRLCRPPSVNFTVNCGVGLDALRFVLDGTRPGAGLPHSSCFPYFRIGQAMGDFGARAGDVWWTLEPGNESEPIANVKAALREKALPTLLALDSPDRVHEHITNKKSTDSPFELICMTVVAHLRGDDGATLGRLAQLREDLAPIWHERIDSAVARIEGRP